MRTTLSTAPNLLSSFPADFPPLLLSSAIFLAVSISACVISQLNCSISLLYRMH